MAEYLDQSAMAQNLEASCQSQSELDIGQHEEPDQHMKDELLAEELEKDNFYFRKAGKWVVRILLFFLALASLLFGKVAFVSLARDIKNLNDTDASCGRGQSYWRMYWVVVIPYFLCLLRCVWKSLGKPRLRFPWPSKRQLPKVKYFDFLVGVAWPGSCLITSYYDIQSACMML